MSFTRSTFNFTAFSVQVVCMDGSNAIATHTSTNIGIIYSTDSGQTWSQSTGDATSKSFSVLCLNGTTGKGIAAASGASRGIFYTNDSGASWSSSNLTSGLFNSLYMNGVNAIAGGGGIGIYYSIGNNFTSWTQSNLTTQEFNGKSIFLNGDNGFAASSSVGVFYTINKGQTWTQSNLNTGGLFSSGVFYCGFMVGNNGVIGGSSSSGVSAGMYYTTDSGATWTRCRRTIVSTTTTFNTGIINCVYMDGTNGIAGSGSSLGIYYTINSGELWTRSASFTTANLTAVYLVGQNGIAARVSGGVIYTNNAGITWAQATGTSNSVSYSDVAMFRLNGIVVGGNTTTTGPIFYNTTNLCYGKDVEILCLIDEKEVFVKITDLKKNMLVKTYKKGYKKITHYTNFNYLCIDETDNLNCLYKLKNKNIIMTGGHSILVDNLTACQENNIYQFKEMIEDKHLLLSCLSDDFEKINDKNEHELYHFVLENEDRNGHYGVYITDYMLSESCSAKLYERVFNKNE